MIFQNTFPGFTRLMEASIFWTLELKFEASEKMFWLWLVQTRMEVWYQNSIWNEEWIQTGDSGIKIDANNRIICRSDPKQTRCFVGNRLKTQIWPKTNKSFLFRIELVKRGGRNRAFCPAGLSLNPSSAEIFCLLLSSWTVETKPI